MDKKGLEKWLDRMLAEGKAVTYPCGHFAGREWCRSFDKKTGELLNACRIRRVR